MCVCVRARVRARESLLSIFKPMYFCHLNLPPLSPSLSPFPPSLLPSLLIGRINRPASETKCLFVGRFWKQKLNPHQQQRKERERERKRRKKGKKIIRAQVQGLSGLSDERQRRKELAIFRDRRPSKMRLTPFLIGFIASRAASPQRCCPPSRDYLPLSRQTADRGTGPVGDCCFYYKLALWTSRL